MEPLSDAAALVPLDRSLLLPAIEERFGKLEPAPPGAWMDLDAGYAVLERVVAEKIAAAFFPIPGDYRWFKLEPRVLRLGPREARRWSKKLTGDDADREWSLEIDAAQANALEEAIGQHAPGLRAAAAPEILALNRRRALVSLSSQRSYVADYLEKTRDGKTVFEPVTNTVEDGFTLDILPVIGEGGSVQVFLSWKSLILVEVPQITGGFGDELTLPIDVPQVFMRARSMSARVTAGSPGVVLGYCLGEETEVDVLWLWIRIGKIEPAAGP